MSLTTYIPIFVFLSHPRTKATRPKDSVLVFGIFIKIIRVNFEFTNLFQTADYLNVLNNNLGVFIYLEKETGNTKQTSEYDQEIPQSHTASLSVERICPSMIFSCFLLLCFVS